MFLLELRYIIHYKGAIIAEYPPSRFDPRQYNGVKWEL